MKYTNTLATLLNCTKSEAIKFAVETTTSQILTELVAEKKRGAKL